MKPYSLKEQVRTFLVTSLLVMGAFSNAHAAINGASDLKRQVESDHPNQFSNVMGMHWLLSEKSKKELTLEITPAGAFQVSKNGKNLFDVELENPKALLTADGKLKAITIKSRSGNVKTKTSEPIESAPAPTRQPKRSLIPIPLPPPPPPPEKSIFRPKEVEEREEAEAEALQKPEHKPELAPHEVAIRFPLPLKKGSLVQKWIPLEILEKNENVTQVSIVLEPDTGEIQFKRFEGNWAIYSRKDGFGLLKAKANLHFTFRNKPLTFHADIPTQDDGLRWVAKKGPVDLTPLFAESVAREATAQIRGQGMHPQEALRELHAQLDSEISRHCGEAEETFKKSLTPLQMQRSHIEAARWTGGIFVPDNARTCVTHSPTEDGLTVTCAGSLSDILRSSQIHCEMNAELIYPDKAGTLPLPPSFSSRATPQAAVTEMPESFGE